VVRGLGTYSEDFLGVQAQEGLELVQFLDWGGVLGESLLSDEGFKHLFHNGKHQSRLIMIYLFLPL